MRRRNKTAEEYNIQHIRRNLKLIAARKITLKEAGLNDRLKRLKGENIGMHEELHLKYVAVVKRLNNLKTRELKSESKVKW